MHEKWKRDHRSHKYLANTTNSIVPFFIRCWFGFFARSDKKFNTLTISRDKKEADADSGGSDRLSALSGQFEDIHTPSIQEEYFLQKYSVGQKSNS